MVHVSAAAGDFCIDAHEATRAEYGAFLLELQHLPPQPSYCAWKGNYFPDGDVTPPVGDTPVGGVDFCDARAYCEWTGKRLCGAIGGGPGAFTGPTVNTTSEWYTACSHDGSRTYPYGDTFDAARCNGAPGTASQPRPASQGTCEGGYDGLFDMSGNMGEWEDSCNSYTTGSTDYCRLRGGGFTESGDRLRCDYVDIEVFRDSRFASAGIRCCAP
jgi:formylglycine-generating enzyme required for sulfatase activity